MGLSEKIQTQVNAWMCHYFAPVLGDKELLALLRMHFDRLDVAPKDGIIEIAEIKAAQANPPDEFSSKDIAMLELLETYYKLLKEFHDGADGADPGISQHDIDVLEKCLQEAMTDKLLQELNEQSLREDQ